MVLGSRNQRNAKQSVKTDCESNGQDVFAKDSISSPNIKYDNNKFKIIFSVNGIRGWEESGDAPRVVALTEVARGRRRRVVEVVELVAVTVAAFVVAVIRK